MAWEWIGTSAVGIAGIVAAYRAGERGRQHAQNLADEKHRRDVALAREQRQYDRRAEAYVEVLTMAERIGQWVLLVEPPIDVGISAPLLPDLVEQAHNRALVEAFGSDEARRLFAAWNTTVQEAVKTVQLIRLGRASVKSGLPVDDLQRQLEGTVRSDEQAARRSMAAGLGKELRALPIRPSAALARPDDTP
jgi:hypothetical protein